MLPRRLHSITPSLDATIFNQIGVIPSTALFFVTAIHNPLFLPPKGAIQVLVVTTQVFQYCRFPF